MRRLLPFMLFVACAVGVAQDAPKVVSLSPDHLAEVSASKTTTLTVVFDRAMNQGGFSVCGGGPSFPKVSKRPRWTDDRTLVIDVELVPDHTYKMSLNCPSAQSFRSKAGAALVPVPWSFSTLPAKLRPKAEQSKRNRKALRVLMATLRERYSYYDRRVDDWQQLEAAHKERILAARTDRGFAVEAARMLKPTEDLHLYLRCGGQVFATGSRAVDSLYRDRLVRPQMGARRLKRSARASVGRTDDGIGYLLVESWQDLDPEVVGGAITELMDSKALIVDVRPNAGGNEVLARQVAAWFVDGTAVYARHRTRTKAGKQGFADVQERKITGHGPDRHYDRPVVVLTSRYCMSSNEAFVLMMKATGATLVGQPTFGSSGNPKKFELGNGVSVMVPSWQAMRADGTVFEGEGIEPDVFVPVHPDDLQSRDPILDKALDVLRDKLGR